MQLPAVAEFSTNETMGHSGDRYKLVKWSAGRLGDNKTDRMCESFAYKHIRNIFLF